MIPSLMRLISGAHQNVRDKFVIPQKKKMSIYIKLIMIIHFMKKNCLKKAKRKGIVLLWVNYN